MKRRKIRYADRRTVQACIDQLQAIIDGLRTGSIGIQHEQEAVQLKPGGDVELEVRVEQLERKETLRVEMSWRPESRGIDSAPDPGAREAAVGQPGTAAFNSESGVDADSAPSNVASTPARDTRGPISMPAPDRMLSDHERLFAAFRTQGGDGRWRIDQDGLAQSLARAGVDPLLQQELYALAMQQDADGHAPPLSERVFDALKLASQPPPPSSHG
jgi:amphi-Trp domain-containing protein